MKMRIVLSFEIAFPNEDPKTIDAYLKGISRDMLLQVSPFLLGLNPSDSKYNNISHFLNMFFSKGNLELAQEVYKNVKEHIEQAGHTMDQYTIPYTISSLSLFEYVFNNINTEETTLSKEQVEENIFKAYLLFNQLNTKERDVISKKTTDDLDKKEKGPTMSISLFLHHFDITNFCIRKVFTTQLLRGIYFFEFLENRADCKLLVSKFYEEYGVSDYHEYLKRISPLVIGIIKKEKEAHTDISLDESNEAKDYAFLNKFIINPLAKIEEQDYSDLRSTPMIRIDEQTYRIISPLFVLEMIYNGLYWKFKHVNDNSLDPKKRIKLLNLKTHDFSEKYVLYKVLKDCFGNRYFQITGDELAKYDGAPDYYVRNGKKVFIFESKDIMICAKVKQSSDFNIIHEEIRKKLYENEEGKRKAILQFINNIRKVLSNDLAFDKKCKGKNAVINPVLILHYRVFNCPGMNKLLNFWFQKELESLRDKEKLDTKNVNPLVIIDIETLLYNKDVFSSRKLDLEPCLNEYQNDYLNFTIPNKKYSNKELVNAQKRSYNPFSIFLDNKVDRLQLREVLKELREKKFGIE